MMNAIAQTLERYMDLLSARQKLVASNIANADTPGFKTKDIAFQTEFQNHVDQMAPRPVEVAGLKTRNDGNNVNVDRESQLLSENAIRFQLASLLLKGEIRAVKSAIQEGKTS